MILKTAGSQTITATDTVHGTLTGARPSRRSGRRQRLRGHDQLRQSRRGRHGGHGDRHRQGRVRQHRRQRTRICTRTVDLSHTDTKAAGLPASHMFAAADAGSYTSPAWCLKTAGTPDHHRDRLDRQCHHRRRQNQCRRGAGCRAWRSRPALRDPTWPARWARSPSPRRSITTTPSASGPNQYEGTVNLTRHRRHATGLPSSYPFTTGDAGSHTFQNVALKTAGSQTITATDPGRHAHRDRDTSMSSRPRSRISW